MFPGVSEQQRRSLIWSIFVIACVSYVCLGWAEQGRSGSAMAEPPSSPLPFERNAVFGLDLRQHSSLTALQWLTAAGELRPALTIIPVDADVVVALQEGEIQEAALSATDSLVAAGEGLPLGTCLRNPETTADLEVVARVATESLIERYPDVIAYVFACEPHAYPEWQQAVSSAMTEINPRIAGTHATMMPVSGGAPVTLIDTDNRSDVRSIAETRTGSTGYSIVSLYVETPLTVTLLEDAQAAIEGSAHVGLVLLRPARTFEQDAIAAALQAAPVQPALMLEGFSNARSSAIRPQGEWQPARVGTVEYLRTTAGQAALSTEFVGTDIYLLAVRSPNAGRVHVWIDPPLTGTTTAPDVVLDLAALQARDIAYPLFTGLSASRHRLVMVTENSEGTNVMISGFFVSGQPSSLGVGVLAAAGLLAAAVVALADRCAASIASIRRSTGPAAPEGQEHPRGYRRRD